jgi:hypothetical protein
MTPRAHKMLSQIPCNSGKFLAVYRKLSQPQIAKPFFHCMNTGVAVRGDTSSKEGS